MASPRLKQMCLCSESVINDADRTRTLILETFSFYCCPPAPFCARQRVHTFRAGDNYAETPPLLKFFCFTFPRQSDWASRVRGLHPGGAGTVGEGGGREPREGRASLELSKCNATAQDWRPDAEGLNRGVGRVPVHFHFASTSD